MQLAATDAEKRDIGGALADALSYFDETAPIVKLLNILGPWSGVIDGVASAVYSRVIYIAEHRSGRAPSPAPAERPRVDTGFNGRASRSEDPEIYAPIPEGFG